MGQSLAVRPHRMCFWGGGYSPDIQSKRGTPRKEKKKGVLGGYLPLINTVKQLNPTTDLAATLSMPKDQEHNAFEVHYITGYPSLAAFIASDRDRSTHIYRRFDRLATRNILYLQSELAELEDQQDKYDAEDLKRTTQEKKSAGNWRVFKEKASEPGDVKEKARMELVKEIEEKIKRYRTSYFLSNR